MGKAWTKVLDWDGKDEFNKASDNDWQLDGKTVARLRKARSFHFMQVFDAGHMVPMDQPAVSLAMVNAFIGGRNVRSHGEIGVHCMSSSHARTTRHSGAMLLRHFHL